MGVRTIPVECNQHARAILDWCYKNTTFWNYFFTLSQDLLDMLSNLKILLMYSNYFNYTSLLQGVRKYGYTNASTGAGKIGVGKIASGLC